MLIDHYLPGWDAAEIQRAWVNAPADLTYAAIRETNLREPLLDLLFAIRELPTRLARRLRGEAQPQQQDSITFADLARPEMGFMPLAEEPGSEFVVGAVGRFWQRDYGWHQVPPDQFTSFMQPGYAKLAISFSVHAADDGCVLRYEVRTATTDDASRRLFRRYWFFIHPGVRLVMRSALRRIAAAAESRHPASVVR